MSGGGWTAVTARLGILLVAATLLSVRAAEAPMEYRVKAAFLYNFARFVEWPEGRRGGPLVIGVLGTDPLHGALVETVRGKSVDDRPIEVRRLAGVEGVSGCAILFVSASERDRWHEILRPLRHSAVLTVGDGPGFLASGGVMNFYLDENRVRFELNPAAAGRSRLKLSAQLIRLARIEVHDDAEGGR
jgi:hypothetical protein